MGAAILYLLLGLNSAVFTVFALRIIQGITKNRPTIPTSTLGYDTDMPSVTVCIPARNEEHALAESLQRVINSTYEKIEIIVLDDSSTDGTSLLIKSFAHAGVRFVRGAALPDGWLGKNHALKELADEANGSYILFLDVDTLLSPAAIEYMVRFALTTGSDMISALPRRNDPISSAVIWSPLKYYWELVRNRPNAPAAASNAWLIKRSTAQRFFDDDSSPIKNAVLPEAYIASQLGQAYRFAISTQQFGVSSKKQWRAQIATSIRLLHPMLGGKTLYSIGTALGLGILTLPYAMVLSSLWVSEPILQLSACVVAILFSSLYAFYAHTFWGKGAVIAFFIWPIIALQEAVLIITSLILYKTGRVLWKGRPLRTIKPGVR